MNLQVEPEAEEYIWQNSATATIFLRKSVRGCCGGVAIPIPNIELGAPEDTSMYTETNAGKVVLFIDNSLEEVKEIRVTLASFLWLKKLSASIVP